MILVDHQIRHEIAQGRIKITPFDDSLINPSSMDVRLGDTFSIVERCLPMEIDPLDYRSFTTRVIRSGIPVYIDPKGFLICHLLEDITLPKDISCKIMGKSSLGRLGIENSSCAGWVDPGWSGVLTIELFNYSDKYIKLTPGMKIGQLIFFKHVPCEVGYGEKITSKYQNQLPGQGSLGIS